MPANRPAGRPRPRTGRTIRPKRTYSRDLVLPAQIRRERRIKPNTVLGIALIVVAVVLAVTHQAEHAGVLDPLPGNLEDLLLGFPMAAVFGIAAFVAFIWK